MSTKQVTCRFVRVSAGSRSAGMFGAQGGRFVSVLQPRKLRLVPIRVKLLSCSRSGFSRPQVTLRPEPGTRRRVAASGG